MKVDFRGQRPQGVTPKDMILAVIGKIGIGGGTGYVFEYCGEAVRGLSMEGRMTICNMSIEGGARAGMVAPDETTFAFVEGRPFSPCGKDFQVARGLLEEDAFRPRSRRENTTQRWQIESDGPCSNGHMVRHESRHVVTQVTRPLCPIPPRFPMPTTRRPPSVHSVTWTWSPAHRSRISPSTGCSSAPVPTRGLKKTCARRRRSSRASTWQEIAETRRWSSPRFAAGEGRRRKGRPRPHLPPAPDSNGARPKVAACASP